jgi:hypothetical protein
MNIEGNGYAAKRYQQLLAERDPFLQRARDAAELTIPYIMPPEGHSASTVYKTPFQGIGARGVNNLASKLLLSLLPPNSPFFRLMIDDFELAKLGDASRGAVEEALGRIERAALQEIEAQAVRVPVFEALKQLIVTGNSLIFLPKKDGMKVFRLDRYVVQRDAMGNVLEVITKESVSPEMLPEEVKAMLDKGEKTEDSFARNLDLYTYVCRKDKKWEVYQEVQGIEVPGSRGSYALDKSPFIPLRFSRIDGEAYGRGFVEEYIGDLKSLESLTQAIVEGSAASAKVLFLVRPNGTTKARALAESPNGAIVNGDANDVTTLQVQKGGDFGVALQSVQAITERLSFAFLLNSSVQRQAERVTAEEVRYMAQELESALGGVYSILSQEFQMPLINLLLFRMESSGKMPKMPKDTVKPTIVTGLEALGRGQDLNRLAQFLQYLQPLGAELIQRELNVGDYIDRLGASLGIDTQGLIRSEEEKQAEAQQAEQQQQQMMNQATMAEAATKSAPSVVKGAYDQAAQGNVDPEMIKQAMAAMQQQ